MENKNQSHLVMHSFCLYPDVKFETQGQDEKIVLVLRAHPFTQIPWVFNTFVALLILVLVNFFAAPILTLGQKLFLNFFGLVFILSYIWFNILSWFFNVGIVTTEQVVDIDFSSVLYKEVSAAKLHHIEDITSKSGGYFESLFNYGDLIIQTAGTAENIEFLNIPKPSEAIEILNGLLGKE